MHNVKATIQYDGTNYQGWQIQATGRTIQGELTRALSLIDHQHVTVHGAGRTDSGVHALGQVASFKLERDYEPVRLRDAINGNLDPEIRLKEVEFVDDDFHARYLAVQKTYRYHVCAGDVVSPFIHRYVYHYRAPLNLDEMRLAACVFEGEHDFASFAGGGSDVESTTRTLNRLSIERDQDSLFITVSANGFLRYMVRMIVGELIQVGRGLRTISDVTERLESSDYRAPRPTAPAAGLTLMQVDY